MKAALLSISLFVILGISFACSILGISLMTYDLLKDRQSLFQDFQLFSLSTIMLLTTFCLLFLVKATANIEAILDSLVNYFTHEIDKSSEESSEEPKKNIAPFILGHWNGDNFESSFKGMIIDIGGGIFRYNKTLEDMNTEELEEEKVKAIENQEFERAAKIKSLIENKNK